MLLTEDHSWGGKKGWCEQMEEEEEEEEGLKRVIRFTASKLGACICTSHFHHIRHQYQF